MENYKDKEILEINRLAMLNLKSPESLAHLRSAENLLMNSSVRFPSKLWALTFHNLGCYYKHTNEYSGAHHFFTKALETDTHPVRSGGTLLELASLYAKQHKFKAALRSSQKALSLLVSYKKQGHKPLYQVTLALAYHSHGFHLESLGNKQEAIEIYKKGLNYAKSAIPDHFLVERLKKSIDRLSHLHCREFTPPQKHSRLVKSRSHTRRSIRSENCRTVIKAGSRPFRNPLEKLAIEEATRALSELKTLQKQRESFISRADTFLNRRVLEVIPE